jgi:hypothetical protein
MSNEEINLLDIKLYIEYYKNNNILDKFCREFEGHIVLDNDVLKSEIDDFVYVTTLNNYKQLQQKNEELKNKINGLRNNILKDISVIKTLPIISKEEIIQRLEENVKILKSCLEKDGD